MDKNPFYIKKYKMNEEYSKAHVFKAKRVFTHFYLTAAAIDTY